LPQAGLPKDRFHDLRQTACSLLLAAGVSVLVASGKDEDSAAIPQFFGTTSTLQIRKKKHWTILHNKGLDNKNCQC